MVDISGLINKGTETRVQKIQVDMANSKFKQTMKTMKNVFGDKFQTPQSNNSNQIQALENLAEAKTLQQGIPGAVNLIA